jgi:Fe-S cluster biogenesis protein NfuA
MNAVEERLESLRPVLSAHAGGVEVVSISGGVVRIRYTGMCTGCHLRPATTAGTVRPALLDLDGVTAVEVEGSRISAQAEARLSRALERAQSSPLSIRPHGQIGPEP